MDTKLRPARLRSSQWRRSHRSAGVAGESVRNTGTLPLHHGLQLSVHRRIVEQYLVRAQYQPRLEPTLGADPGAAQHPDRARFSPDAPGQLPTSVRRRHVRIRSDFHALELPYSRFVERQRHRVDAAGHAHFRWSGLYRQALLQLALLGSVGAGRYQGHAPPDRERRAALGHSGSTGRAVQSPELWIFPVPVKSDLLADQSDTVSWVTRCMAVSCFHRRRRTAAFRV